MKQNYFSMETPKTRKAALNSYLYLSMQRKNLEKKGDNILKQKNAASEKLTSLQEVIQNCEELLASNNTNKEVLQKALDTLKETWELTEDEVIGLRKDLLTSQVISLQEELGVKERTAPRIKGILTNGSVHTE